MRTKRIFLDAKRNRACLDELFEILTDDRLQTLRVIRHQTPNSITGLAKILKRNLKSTQEDVKLLASLDLLSLKKPKDMRRRVKPHVGFDSISVEIAM